MSSNKRPGEPLENGSPSKLVKPDLGRPISTAELLAAKRAEIAAKLAAYKQGALATSSAPSTVGSRAPASSVASPSGILNGNGAPSSISPAGVARPSSLPAGLAPDLAARIEAAKAKVLAATAARGIATGPPATAHTSPAPEASSSSSRPASGLNMAIHPSLLESSTPSFLSTSTSTLSYRDRHKALAPKFATLKANARNSTPAPPTGANSPVPVERVNPYLTIAAETATAAKEAAAESGEYVPTPRERRSRKFNFVQQGKYVALADQMRADANMEALKKRIADAAKKAGLDSEFDASERTLRREPPPEVEWWDEPLLTNKTYDDVEASKTKIDAEDSPITPFVQHPIQIQAPWDKKKVEPRPLMLTKKEAKKMRKQRRMADLKDRQDRVRMGLIPPDKPKVSIGNLMKVLASDAIQDPTKVEAKVRREVKARRVKHEKTNEARKLTHEQRKEKEETQKLKEEDKGLYGAVFKIKYLSNPGHKFKVRENATQNNLTGCCIFNPKFCLVLVEGSAKAIKFYKRVMLVRIDWTEEARNVDGDEDPSGEPSTREGGGEEEEQNMEDNRCDLVWEGPIRERNFKFFKPKSTESERMAREFLGEKNQGYWDVASKFVPDDF
ncbi:Putative u4/u6 small nuclear ribonucleoprotein [Phaffia rhodozyma]|uniref:Putative u4/u6 small nuclear ribonucleoprotein n=1 Tax=Phaffia rhodozyma TaxID=264483 RepID=A0A0F7SNE9_PHARH|nr:Putative u4/u6 small nuclear ribonucleoprotein [Phaffia rhodozyma]